MAKRGPKKGHIEKREAAAKRKGQAEIFGLANSKTKKEGVVSRIVRRIKGKGIFEG